MEYYVARQPILDIHKNVFAYELLYRSSQSNTYSAVDGDKATGEVIANSMLLIGLDEMTQNRKAFINFTERMLEEKTAKLLPPDKVVVEVLENVRPDDRMLAFCRELKEIGYTLALDDFIYSPSLDPFIEIADIIKVDFLLTQGREREWVVRKLKRKGLSFLAEKVETEEDFIEAKNIGYSYFQGYFFSKPVIVSGTDIPGFKMAYMNLMREIHQPEADIDTIEKVIKADVSLSYKLLRFINSVNFGLKNRVNSIRQAIVILGQKEMRKWATLVSMKELVSDHPDELLTTAVVRATFCEEIAAAAGMRSKSSDLFLMGLFSLIDVFLSRPLNEVMRDLPLEQDIRGALLGEDNSCRKILLLVVGYEKGYLQEIAAQTNALGIKQEEVVTAYLEAIKKSTKLLSGI